MKKRKYQVGGIKFPKLLDNVPTPDEFAASQGLPNPKANSKTLDFQPNYGMKPTFPNGAAATNLPQPFGTLENTGDLTYHPIFKALNLLAQLTTGISNKVTDAGTDRKNREAQIRAFQNPNFSNASQDGLDNSPIYAKYGIENKKKKQTGGKGQKPILEEGEVYDTGEDINKIPDDAGTHEEGGVVPADNVERVLEDTSDKRKDKASQLLKLQPKTVEAMLGFKPKTALSHSKAHERAVSYYNKKSDSILGKVKKNTESREDNDNDKYALNSLKFNTRTASELPSEEQMFDILFDHQEQVKSLYEIKDNGNKAQYGNFPQKRATVEDNPYNFPVKNFSGILKSLIFPAQQEPIPNTDEYFPENTTLEDGLRDLRGRANVTGKSGTEYPLNWFDLAAPLDAYLGATKAHVNYNPATTHQIRLRGVNPLPTLQQGQSDFNNEVAALANTGVNGGVQFANLGNLYARKYALNNQVLGSAENTNAGIKNQETEYNARAADQQSVQDQQAKELFERKNLGTDEAVRQQKLTAEDSIFSRIAQNKKFNFEKDLLLKLFPNFTSRGDYNGKRYNFRNPLATNEGGIPSIDRILENAGIDPATIPPKDRARYAVQIAKKKYFPTRRGG